jgi:hypothetical protein
MAKPKPQSTRSTRSASKALSARSTPAPETKADSITVKSASKEASPTVTPAAGKKRKATFSTGSSVRKIVLSKKRKNDAAKWSIPFVFTDARSPLVKTDLRVCLPPISHKFQTNSCDKAILLHPKAWDSLSLDEQEVLRDMLGLDKPEGETDKPDLNYLRSDDSFRSDCERYKEGIENEQFHEGWLRDAWTAHERRRRGDFKEFLAGKLERDWGASVPEVEEEVDGEEEEEGRGEEEATSAARGGSKEGSSPMGPPQGPVKRLVSQESSPTGNRSVEMKSVGERSRETSGSHSIVSSVGERKFTRLELGLQDHDEEAGEANEDDDQEVQDEIVAAG